MARVPLLLGCLLAALASAVVALALAEHTPENLLQNGSFEDWGSGDPVGWFVLDGSLDIVTAPDPVADGVRAAKLTAGQVHSPARAFQTVNLDPGWTYELSGWGLVNDERVEFALLRIEWTKPDNSRDFKQTISFDGLGGEYSQRAIDATIPCGASEIQVLIRVEGHTGTSGAFAYFDDLRLTQVEQTEACATPTPPPSVTATITPTAPATPTPSPTASVTPSPTATVSPATTTPTRTSTATPAPTSTQTSPSPVPTVSPIAPPTPSPTLTPSHGFLVNGGFEAATDGIPVGWETNGGLLAQVDAPVRSGDFAAAFFSSTASTKWFYQTVAVTPTAWYEMESYVYQDDPWVETVLLRISWYSSPDGSGSAVATVDSIAQLSDPEPAYRYLTTGPVQAPPGAHSARVRILLRPVSEVNALIYADDVSLLPASQPPTPTWTATSTPPPAASATSTPSPPPTPTPAPTTTPAATPSPAPQATAPVTATPQPGTQPTASATPVPSPSPSASPAPSSTPSPAPPPSPASPPAPGPAEPVSSPTPSHGLLVNGGFEAADEGMPIAWDKYGGVLSLVEEPVRTGRFAAALYSSTGSTKWLFQTVPVTPTAWYELEGYVYQGDPWVEAALLRISWYTASDGSGSALATADSTEKLVGPEPGYRYLTTGPVQAPPRAHSAKARILLRPVSETSALIYVDDVSFLPAAQPPLPAAPAAQAPVSDSGSAASARRASTAAGSSSASQVASAVVDHAAAPTPQATPVIRRGRSALVVPAEELSSPGATSSQPWWTWLLAGAVLAGGAAGWGAWWGGRRGRRTQRMHPAQPRLQPLQEPRLVLCQPTSRPRTA